jgi:GNAT superfamily N-acetyltransferase
MRLSDFYTRQGSSLEPFDGGDTDILVALINRAYSYQDTHKKAPRTNPDHLRKRAAETDLYVLKKDQKIIGCVYIDTHESVLHFGLLTVDEEYRGKGYAQAMIAAIDTYAKATGYQSLQLDYMSVAPWLKAYYERYGFCVTGEVIPWGTIDLVKMEKTL